MQILTNSIIRDLENFEISVRNRNIWELISQASTQIYYESQFILRSKSRACILGYVGKGNNGADTLLALSFLARHGHLIYAQIPLGVESLNPWGKKALEKFLQAGGTLLEMNEVLRADLALDGLLGSGCKGPARGKIRDAILHLNQSQHHCVLAIDCPSGLNPNSGIAEGECVGADLTLCLGFGKEALAQKQAENHVGSIEIAPMNFPEQKKARRALSRADLRAFLPSRPPSAHKGQMGRLALFCGSEQFPGAGELCAIGALSSGCGLIESQRPSMHPEIIPLDPAKDKQALVFGPGIGQGQDAKKQLAELWQRTEALLIDADGLSLLASSEFKNRSSPLALSPHPKEAALLLGTTTAEILAHPSKAVLELALMYSASVYLKGRMGWMANPSGEIWQCLNGNALLARGGSGDLLAGLWGGLMARTGETWNSGLCAVWLMGRASDLCKWEWGAEGHRHSQLPWGIARAWQEIQHQLPQ